MVNPMIGQKVLERYGDMMVCIQFFCLLISSNMYCAKHLSHRLFPLRIILQLHQLQYTYGSLALSFGVLKEERNQLANPGRHQVHRASRCTRTPVTSIAASFNPGSANTGARGTRGMMVNTSIGCCSTDFFWVGIFLRDK